MACCAVSGETGKSVSQYSAEWLKTVPLMKNVIKGNKALRDSDVLVSTSSMHWVKLTSMEEAS